MQTISMSRVLSAAEKKKIRRFKINSNRLDLMCKQFQLTFDWNNELWNNWEYLSTAFFEHIKDSLHSEESVWVLFLTDALKEDR